MDSKKFNTLIDTPRVKESLAKVLGSSIPLDKFIGAAKGYYAEALLKEKTAKLANADERSIWLALQRAARDGLLLDGIESCLMVFGGQAQYNPMTWGLTKLILSSGFVAKLTTYLVFEKEQFEIEIVDGEERMRHKPLVFATEKEKGERIGVYAMAKLTDGNVLFKFLGKEKILKLRAKSQKKDLWDVEADEFWAKSALRQIAKYLPKTMNGKLDAVKQAIDESLSGDNDQDKNGAVKESLTIEEPANETVEAINSDEESQANIGKLEGLALHSPADIKQIVEEKAKEGMSNFKSWYDSLADIFKEMYKDEVRKTVEQLKQSSSKLNAIVNEEDIF